MNKATTLYGSEEDFQSLRDLDANRVYAHHRTLLRIQKEELMERDDWTEPLQQHRLNEIEAGLKHWDSLTRMVMRH